MFFDHNRIKLEMSTGKNSGNTPKYLEIKQHTSQPMGQKINHKRNFRIFWMKKIQYIKIYEMQLKQYLEGNV